MSQEVILEDVNATSNQKLQGSDSSGKAHIIEKLASSHDRNSWSRKLGFATVLALFVTGTMTFLILFGLTPLEPSSAIVRSALVVNTLLALVLISLIAVEVSKLLQSRRKGRAAARLHIRIVGLFALVAAIPAILVAIVASITLDLGLDRWFEIRTKQIVESSVSVAQAYLDESTRVHVNATLSMANDLDSARQIYSLDRATFIRGMSIQTRGRGMLMAQLVRENGEVIIETKVDEKLILPAVPKDSLKAAESGELIFIPRSTGTLVGAVKKLQNIPDVYLYSIRPLREDVLKSLRLMEENTSEYNDLANNRIPVQLTFAVLYLAVALMILLAAIYMGISVAERFVQPIRRLITAADEVSAGNLEVHVDTKHTEGDFKNLSETFNVMISDLKDQRSELVQAKDDIDQRARFTQAVLSGVTAAVIGVDQAGSIKIANKAALNLFQEAIETNKSIKTGLPLLWEVQKNALASNRPDYREQISMNLNGQSRNLNVQVTRETEVSSSHSFVITVDDITDLVAAQRSTAWSDVARRIAHEIKNPLTPIQLSAERLRKRYSKYITEDKEVFDQCTETIIRQVGDIGRMVDEFSSFARMPKPEMLVGDISATVQEAMFTQRVANPEIEFILDLGGKNHVALFDARLLSQALINVIKNAVEAIEAARETVGAGHKGRIKVAVSEANQSIFIDVIDNGKGLPAEDRQKLLEPYMTTRQKGTGLGLAIVRKILEDHGGTIELLDAPDVATGGNGARMRLRIPVHVKQTTTPSIDTSANSASEEKDMEAKV